MDPGSTRVASCVLVCWCVRVSFRWFSPLQEFIRRTDFPPPKFVGNTCGLSRAVSTHYERRLLNNKDSRRSYEAYGAIVRDAEVGEPWPREQFWRRIFKRCSRLGGGGKLVVLVATGC